jgi:hypothetical protein
MTNISQRIISVSRFLIITIGSFYTLVYLVSSFARIIYPFAILNVEGASFQVLHAITIGYPLYGEPNIHYISIVYTPLYFLLSYLLSLITGSGYLPLRLLSFISSLGISIVIYSFVKKETNSTFLSLSSAFFYMLIYPLTGSWLDLAKPDSLMLLVLLISLYVIRFKDGLWSSFLAGLLLAIAYMVKQQAFSIGVVLMLYLLFTNFKKGIAIISTCMLSILFIHIIIDLVTQGWFTYFTFTLPSAITYKTIMYDKLINFFTKDNLTMLPIVVSFIVLYFIYGLKKDGGKTPLFYLTLLVSFIVGILPTRIIFGGSLNSLMPYYVMLTIMAGISIDKIISLIEGSDNSDKMATAFIYLLLTAQFIMLMYNPLSNFPRKEQARENEQTINDIQSYKSEVFVENFGQLAVKAGKNNTPHFGTLDDILIGDHGKVKDDIKAKFIKAFTDKHYSAVFLEDNWLNYDFGNEIRNALDENYIKVGTDSSKRFTIYEPK